MRCVLEERGSIRGLAREYGISRTTAYKWLERAHSGDLSDRSRRPHKSPNRVPEGWQEAILALKDANPAWGARKIRVTLERHHQDAGHLVPSAASVHRILARAGRVQPAVPPVACTRFERSHPNELWQLDFKGHVPLTNGERLHPLSLLDDCTRFVVGVAALPGETKALVWPRLVRAFRENGLPDSVLCDHGSPWGTKEERVTTLARKLIRLGVRVLHGRARHPQTQGKLERLNRTLKEELLSRAAFKSLREAQAALEAWRESYNHCRPHEALGMLVPAERYTRSSRVFPERLSPIEYQAGDVVRRVQDKGVIHYRGRVYKVGSAFKGEPVALRPTSLDGVLSVVYCQQEIASINLQEQ